MVWGVNRVMEPLVTRRKVARVSPAESQISAGFLASPKSRFVRKSLHSPDLRSRQHSVARNATLIQISTQNGPQRSSDETFQTRNLLGTGEPQVFLSKVAPRFSLYHHQGRVLNRLIFILVISCGIAGLHSGLENLLRQTAESCLSPTSKTLYSNSRLTENVEATQIQSKVASNSWKADFHLGAEFAPHCGFFLLPLPHLGLSQRSSKMGNPLTSSSLSVDFYRATGTP